MKEFLKKISWGGTLFLGLTPLVSIAGLLFLWRYDAIRWPTVAFTAAMAIVTGISVTAGYHRMFAHKSFEAKWPIKLLFLLFGAASFENSALWWASDHRNHHKYVDTDRDPYNIKKGFWYAHMGWICFKRLKEKRDNVLDLEKDRLVWFQHRYFLSISVLTGFVFPMAVASLWGDALGGLLLAGFLRIVLNHHFTFLINSVCHYYGRQPYSDRNSSRDSLIPALFTYGEGYHNYHHTFPSDYRNGIRPYHWDPTKWLIRTLAWMGQAYDLRRIANDKILQVRLRMDEKRLLRTIEQAGKRAPLSQEFVVSARQKLERTYLQFQSLRTEYRRLKKQKIDSFNRQWLSANESLRRDVRGAKRQFKEAVSDWRRLCRNHGHSKLSY